MSSAESQGAASARTTQSKTEIGIVTSDKMDKTLVVKVTRVSKHAKYGKYVKRSKSFQVHDENNEGAIGDRVKISETRPLSKHKRWRLVKIVKHQEA